MATAEQLALARKIVKQFTGFPPDMVDAGLFDRTSDTKAILAAIIETTELAAKWMDRDAKDSAIARSAAASLRNFDHLKEHHNGE